MIFDGDNGRFIDLSHHLEDGMVTYKGLPAPLICDYLSREQSRDHYEEGTSFQIGKIEMVANTGTYMDAPFHRYAKGRDLSDLDLDRIADLDAVKVTPGPEVEAIDESWFEDIEVAGRAVLVQTGWSRHWGTERYFEGHPFLTRRAAESLRDRGALTVGIDSYNIDDTRGRARPVHSTLLGADITIVEHMTNLAALPARGARFFATPVKVRGMGTFPVRAFAILPRPGRCGQGSLK